MVVCFFYLFTQSAVAEPQILFDGYYKLLSGGIHVGYVIQRYQYDPKLKQFISTYYLKTGALAGNITESLKAYATDNLTRRFDLSPSSRELA